MNDKQLYPYDSGQEIPREGPHEYYPDYAKSMEKDRVEVNFGRHYPMLHLVLLFFVLINLKFVENQ